MTCAVDKLQHAAAIATTQRYRAASRLSIVDVAHSHAVFDRHVTHLHCRAMAGQHSPSHHLSSAVLQPHPFKLERAKVLNHKVPGAAIGIQHCTVATQGQALTMHNDGSADDVRARYEVRVNRLALGERRAELCHRAYDC